MFAAGFSPAPLCHPQASSSSGPQRRLALAHAASTPPAGGKEPSSDKASLPSGRPKAGSAAASAPKPASSSRTKDWLSSWAADSPGSSQSRPKPGLGSSAAQEGGVESGIARTRARIGAWDSQVKLAARPPSSQQALGTGARASAALPSSNRPAAAVAVQPVGPGMVQAADGSWRLEGCRQEQVALAVAAPELQSRLLAAVRAEQEAEAQALAALYSRTSLAKLQQDGLVLAGLRAQLTGELYRNVVWRFELPPPGGQPGPGPQLPYHKFRQGDSVLVSRLTARSSGPAPVRVRGSSSDEEGEEGDNVAWYVDATCVEVRRNHLLLALERKDSARLEGQAALHGGRAARWRLDSSVRDTTATRQREALGRLAVWGDAAAAAVQGAHDSSPAGEQVVRLVLVGASRSRSPLLAELPPLWARDAGWRGAARSLLAQQTQLNDSQRRAVALALVRSVTLWQGPPGTGKTRTLLALVTVLASSAATLPAAPAPTVGFAPAGPRVSIGQVLACADTNAAVDNLVEGLAARGLAVVRLGNPAKVRPALRHLTLEAVAERETEAGRRSAALRQVAQRRLDELRARKERESNPAAVELMAAAEASARNDLAQADAALRSAMDLVLVTAQVVCCTCTGAGDSMLTDRVFKAVVLDEATQATEPATLIPLVRGAQCVVMAGDPRQLPPTVVSQQALALRLDVTLFDRVSASGVAPLLLDTQYRMHPAIAAFASQHFYQGRLRDGVEAADKPAAAGFPWPAGPTAPLAWLEVRGREETAQLLGARGPAAEVQDAEEGGNGGPGQMGQQQRAGKGTGAAGGGSYQNLAEAEAAIQVLQRVLAGGDVSSVALLTPYRGQVRALEAGLRGLQAAWPQLAAACEAGRLELSVSSVDGFQGREADVVILSTVRCNRASRVGFVADPRRLNVAITRPRRGLVVVGCSHTLAAGSDDWAAFVRHCEEQGVIMPLHALSPAARQHVTDRR